MRFANSCDPLWTPFATISPNPNRLSLSSNPNARGALCTRFACLKPRKSLLRPLISFSNRKRFPEPATLGLKPSRLVSAFVSLRSQISRRPHLSNFDLMKPASLTAVRRQFAAVSRPLHSGESVIITKQGRPFAVLAPIRSAPSYPPPPVDLLDRLQHQFPGGPVPSSTIAGGLFDTLRGNR